MDVRKKINEAHLLISFCKSQFGVWTIRVNGEINGEIDRQQLR